MATKGQLNEDTKPDNTNRQQSNGKSNGIFNGNTNGDSNSEGKGTWKPIKASFMARNSINPIRQIVDNMSINPNPSKKKIALSIGDPTIFGNLPVCEEILNAVETAMLSQRWNGYGPSVGYEESRAVVAECMFTRNSPYLPKDVILTLGCSGALDMCITVLAGAGDNILVPTPGFPFYQVVAQSSGIETKYYELLPEKLWEIDLDHLESLIDSKTSLIVVNNPSNPCGSVWKEAHLRDIVRLAEKYRLPLISDEIYADFVFEGQKFIPFSSISTTVPVLTCGGLTKKYLIPGWRFGWILIHDPLCLFDYEVRNGLFMLSQKLLGPSSLIQGALPSILKETPHAYIDKSIRLCQANAQCFHGALKKIKGLNPIMPEGAMYMMVGIDLKFFPGIKDDIDFTEKLLEDQSVFCLPSSCFKCKNYFRIVLTVPESVAKEACERIAEFCEHHYVKHSFEPRDISNYSIGI